MPEEKTATVVAAAQLAFTKYGFKRVTMQDIADEAGMSRPALYLVFSNKEEIFRAVISDFSQKAMEEIRTTYPTLPTLEEQLTCALEVWTVRGYEWINTTAEAKEMVDCTHGFARDLVEKVYQDFDALILEIIASHQAELEKRGLDPATFVRLFCLVARSSKEHARDVDDLRLLLKGLVRMSLTNLGAET